jgi:hypothetical protein
LKVLNEVKGHFVAWIWDEGPWWNSVLSRNRKSVWLGQLKYICEKLLQFGANDCKLVFMPFDLNIKFSTPNLKDMTNMQCKIMQNVHNCEAMDSLMYVILPQDLTWLWLWEQYVNSCMDHAWTSRKWPFYN